MSDESRLQAKVQWANERLSKHLELEEKRIKAKLKTDMQRWTDGERIRD